MRPSYRLAVAVCLLSGIFVSVVRGQEPDHEARIKALEERNRQLENEMRRVLERLEVAESHNRELEDRLDAERRDEAAAELEELVNALVQDKTGQNRYGGLSRRGSAIQFYGRVRLDVKYSTGRFDRQIDPFWVRPEDGINADGNDDAFSMDVRTTTIGLDVNAGRIGDAEVSAIIEMDFADLQQTPAESRLNPQIKLAYVNFDFGGVFIRVGQDWDLVGPYDPLVEEHSKLWNTGNVGEFRPMVQLAYTNGATAGLRVDLAVAAGLTGAVDNLDLDTGFGALLTTERDGWDVGHPHVQVAGSLGFDSWVSGKRITIGVWGAWGRLETDTSFVGENEFDILLGGADLFLPLFGPVHIKGEFFIGQALADFRGGIGQSVNTLTGDEIMSLGGWGEIYWQVDSFFGVGAGASIDNPDRGDLGDGMKASNWTIYLATRQDWSENLQTGFDVVFWKTQYVAREDGEALRFAAYVQLSF